MDWKTIGKRMYDDALAHPWVTGFFLAGVLAIGGFGLAAANSGSTVYDRELNNQRVRYEEDDFSFGNLGEYNEMRVKRGQTNFVFDDVYNRHGIEMQSEHDLQFLGDKLERIVISNPQLGKICFNAAEASQDTLYGKHVQRVVDKASEIYNALRGIIREQLRDEEIAWYECLEAELGKIDTTNPKTKSKPCEEKKEKPNYDARAMTAEIKQKLNELEKLALECQGSKK